MANDPDRQFVSKLPGDGAGNAPGRGESTDDIVYEVGPPPSPPEPIKPWGPEPSTEDPRPCPACGYDLRGLRPQRGDFCPECGAKYSDALDAVRKRVEDWGDFLAARWLLYSLVPILLWIPPAWLMRRSAGTILSSLALPIGMIIAFISPVVAARFAMDESSGFGGWGIGLVIMVVGMLINFTIVTIAISYF